MGTLIVVFRLDLWLSLSSPLPSYLILLQNPMMYVGLPVDVVVVDVVVVAPCVELGIGAAEEAAPSREVGEGAVAGGII